MTDGQQAATEFARELNAMTNCIRKEDYQDLETRTDTLTWLRGLPLADPASQVYQLRAITGLMERDDLRADWDRLREGLGYPAGDPRGRLVDALLAQMDELRELRKQLAWIPCERLTAEMCPCEVVDKRGEAFVIYRVTDSWGKDSEGEDKVMINSAAFYRPLGELPEALS